jgi:hypothetical protein
MKPLISKQLIQLLRPRRLPAACAATLLLGLAQNSAPAAAFTPGNLVVERVGDGTQSPASTGNTIFFDEYDRSGNLIQSITIPDTGTTALLDSGTATSDGSFSLAADGRSLCFPGYNTSRPASSSISGAASSSVPRGIGKLDGNGNYTLAVTSTTAYSGNNLRGAATDGNNNFWGSGTGTASGIYYFGTASTAANVYSANLRCVGIFNGNLWYSTASSTPGYGIWKFTGTPTTATGNTATRIVTLASSDSAYNFAVNRDETVLYYADDSLTGRGIHKWTYSSGTWSQAYVLLSTTPCFGLTVDWSTSPATLFFTTTNINNQVCLLQDTGSSATATTLANAGANKTFRGIAFAPTNGASLIAPSINGISPSSIAANAGATATFTVSVAGSAPLSYFWYKELPGTSTNLIAGATNASLTLSNVLGGDAASYQVVVSNASLVTATSAVVTLTISGDPSIVAQPNNAQGLLGGLAQFAVTAAGTAPSYQWFFADASGNLIDKVNNGLQVSGSYVTGSTASTLAVSNLQSADLTNFVVVVTNAFGAVTSSVASLLSVDNTATLVFWDFNGSEFTNTAVNPNSIIHPAPRTGVGLAQAVGSCYTAGDSPFSGSVDPNDGLGFTDHLPPFSWGTRDYPASGGNKQNGVQFDVSTVGADNIKVSYESRVSATASGYERLQYTTNGATWIDYPASSTFGGVATTYLPFSYDLTGFPGVANNPSFGVRIVTEYQKTATYGIGASNSYVGTANTYGTGGTVTYDLVRITGSAITNNNQAPVITSIADVTNADYLPLTVNFTVSDDTTAPDQLTYSAVSLNTAKVSPGFTFGGSGANRTLTINPNTIPDQVDAAPILITVTDANGASTVTWFTLTLTSVNLAPSLSLTSLGSTNTLVNTPLTIPFTASDDRTSASGLTYTVTSGNSTVLPPANIVVNDAGTGAPSLTITPAANQAGVGVITVTVSDNDALEPRSTTATLALIVRPNTNVVAIDRFNYDTDGALDTVSGGFWQHLSGVYGQLKTSSGTALVDTVNNTENLQTPLLGAPYSTNSPGCLYYSFILNLKDSTKLPTANGTYITTFNDGSGVTGYYEDMVLVATNGAAPGNYRLGILNSTNTTPTTAVTAKMFPQDLVPGSNYMVVTSVTLSNGFSTLWINPLSTNSTSVSDTTKVVPLIKIAQFELRESGVNAGQVSLSSLKVGTTFDSVLPALSAAQSGANIVLNWSDPTLGVQWATNVAGPYYDISGTSPYTNDPSTNSMMYFRFKR